MSTTTENPSDDTNADETIVATSDPDRSIRTAMLGLLGIAITGVGVWLSTGGLGMVAGTIAVISLAWYGLDELYAVALGHAAFLWPMSVESLDTALLVAESGLLVLLVAPALDADAPISMVGMTLVGLSGLVAVTAGSYEWSNQLWIAAGVLLGTVITSGYLLYRYELTQFGLIEDEKENAL